MDYIFITIIIIFAAAITFLIAKKKISKKKMNKKKMNKKYSSTSKTKKMKKNPIKKSTDGKAQVVEVKARTRNSLADDILKQINLIGQDRIISIVTDEKGRIANKGGLFSVSKAFIYYK